MVPTYIEPVIPVEDSYIVFVLGAKNITVKNEGFRHPTGDYIEAENAGIDLRPWTSKMTSCISAGIHQVRHVHRPTCLVDFISEVDARANVIRFLKQIIQQNEEVDHTGLKCNRSHNPISKQIAPEQLNDAITRRLDLSVCHPSPLVIPSPVSHWIAPGIEPASHPALTGS
jgi:hypothetical protein